MAHTRYRSSDEIDAAETYPMVTFADAQRENERHAAEQAEIDERTDCSEDVS